MGPEYCLECDDDIWFELISVISFTLPHSHFEMR